MMNPDRRRWHFYYLAGMPAEICDGGEHDAAEAAAKIKEEWPGHREWFLEFARTTGNARRGSVFAGVRFLIVCTA